MKIIRDVGKKHSLFFKSKKLSNQLLLNYIIFLILFFALLFLSILIALGYYVFKYDNDFKNKILAQDIIKEDYKQIDASNILKCGGYIEILDNNMKIIMENGSHHKVGFQYPFTKICEVLTNSERKTPHYYTFEHDKKRKFTLIVAMPKKYSYNILSSTYSVNVRRDGEKISKIKKSIYGIVIFVFLFSTIILYSKLTSRTFVEPLKALLIGVNRVKNGDYSARVEFDSKNEIGQLAEAFNLMATKIQQEVLLREKSEGNRKKMIMDISHDLKNPLTCILGYSEYLLKHENISEDERCKLLTVINSNSNRANDLIGDLFEFSILEGEGYKLDIEEQDICEFARELIAAYIPMMEEKGINYDFDISEDTIMVPFDRKKMDRALSNIILNGIKYNFEGTEIKVSTFEQKDYVEIIIEDDGIGVPKEFKSTVFEPFVRVDCSRNSKTGGTGLGLAISKTIIEKHGGNIELQNEERKGCKFVIKLYKSNFVNS